MLPVSPSLSLASTLAPDFTNASHASPLPKQHKSKMVNFFRNNEILKPIAYGWDVKQSQSFDILDAGIGQWHSFDFDILDHGWVERYPENRTSAGIPHFVFYKFSKKTNSPRCVFFVGFVISLFTNALTTMILIIAKILTYLR